MMNSRDDRHWTDDEDLVARYVLHQLTDVERVPLEEHLRTCEPCQAVVREERTLAAGVQRVGREEMKKRLAHRVGIRPRSRIPWPHVLSAAAVLVLLMGIGLYNRWFLMQTSESDQITDQVAAQEFRREQPADQRDESVPPPATREIRDAPVPEKPQGGREARKTEPRGEVGKEKTREESAADDKDRARAFRTETPAPVAEERNAGVGRTDAMESTPATSIWVEGSVLQNRYFAERVESEGAKSVLRENAALQSAAEPRHRGLQRQKMNGGWVTLSQQPASLLPMHRQQMAGGSVQTRLVRTEEGVELTLYLDTLLSEAELSRATVRELPGDSLEVTLPGRQIVYRLPSGWGQQHLQVPGK